MHIRVMNSYTMASITQRPLQWRRSQVHALTTDIREEGRIELSAARPDISLSKPSKVLSQTIVVRSDSEANVTNMHWGSANHGLRDAGPQIGPATLMTMDQTPYPETSDIESVSLISKKPGVAGREPLGGDCSEHEFEDEELESEIRNCVLQLHRLCATRPASYLAIMLQDFRSGLHRSNIISMFFTRSVSESCKFLPLHPSFCLRTNCTCKFTLCLLCNDVHVFASTVRQQLRLFRNGVFKLFLCCGQYTLRTGRFCMDFCMILQTF